MTSHVVIGGFTKVGSIRSRVNSTLRDSIEIGSKNLIGAGAVVMQSTKDEAVWLPAKSVELNKEVRNWRYSGGIEWMIVTESMKDGRVGSKPRRIDKNWIHCSGKCIFPNGNG